MPATPSLAARSFVYLRCSSNKLCLHFNCRACLLVLLLCPSEIVRMLFTLVVLDDFYPAQFFVFACVCHVSLVFLSDAIAICNPFTSFTVRFTLCVFFCCVRCVLMTWHSVFKSAKRKNSSKRHPATYSGDAWTSVQCRPSKLNWKCNSCVCVSVWIK